MINSCNCKSIKVNIFEWLFFSCYIVIPNYFAIEFSPNIPLLTGSRFLLIILLISLIYKKKCNMVTSQLDYPLGIYFCIMISIDLLHLLDSSTYALKDLFSIIIEQLLVYWVICQVVTSKTKFYKCLKLLLFSSSVVAVLSIIGYFFNTNFFYLLDTVKRNMLMTSNTAIGYRLGSLRIEAGFGHPIYYAVFCCVMAFIGLFFIVKEGKMIYYITFLINLIALFLTNSRGALLAFGLAIIAALFLNKKSDVKKYIRLLGIAIILIAFIFIAIPSVKSYVRNVVVSIIIYFMGDSTPFILKEYGSNVSASSDRLIQFSGIWWTLKNRALIGFGPEANSRGLICYYYLGRWLPTNTFDIGYVALVGQYGSLGFIAHILLYAYSLRASFDKSFKKDSVFGMFRNILIVYFLCMFSSVTIDRLFWVIFSLQMAYYKLVRAELFKEGEKGVL